MEDNNLRNTLMEMVKTEGYNSLSVDLKNTFVSILANERAIPITDITLEYILNLQKEYKIEELSRDCENAVLEGFRSPNGNLYRLNRDDQINMIGQKDLLDSDETIQHVLWKTENNGYVGHTKEEWLHDVYYQGLQSKSNKLFKYNYLKTKVLEADFEEDIIVVNWNMGTLYDKDIVEVSEDQVQEEQTETSN